METLNILDILVSTTTEQTIILNELSKEFYDVPEVIYRLINFNDKLPINFKSSFDYISAENAISKAPNIDFINVRNKIQSNIDIIYSHLITVIEKYPNNFKKLREVLKTHEEQIDIYKLTIATLNKYANETDLSKAPENFKDILQNINEITLNFLEVLRRDL